MNLIEKQQTFAFLFAEFILMLRDRGYRVTYGEMWRPPETAALYAQQGKGIRNSLHSKRLACDINLFRNGSRLLSTIDFREAGELWEAMSTTQYICAWGGRFGDGNHFSIEHNGVK